MKKTMQHFVFFFITGLTFYAHAQEFRKTLVPNSQIRAVVRDVAEWHDMQNPDCLFKKANGSSLVEKVADSSIEHWSIEACFGKNFTYQVFVRPSSDGGVSDSVSNLDGSPIGSARKVPETQVTEECKAERRELEQMGPEDEVPNSKIVRHAQLTANVAACQADAAVAP